jgi:hypothetical protein
MKPRLKSLKNKRPLRDKFLALRLSEVELRQAEKLALKYTDGNLSEWARYAVTTEPRKEDME